MKNRVKTGPERDCERHWREKTTKIASGAVSGRTFSSQEPFFMDFGLPAGTRKSPKNRPWPQSPVYCLRLQSFFWRFVRSGVFRKRPGPILEAPWTLPDQILQGFLAGSVGILSCFVEFRRNVAGIHRQPPELTLRGFSGVRRSRGAN